MGNGIDKVNPFGPGISLLVYTNSRDELAMIWRNPTKRGARGRKKQSRR